eukprot:scaffold1026_cov409-Prasinococcus_capsulatus_cf.AAC.6
MTWRCRCCCCCCCCCAGRCSTSRSPAWQPSSRGTGGTVGLAAAVRTIYEGEACGIVAAQAPACGGLSPVRIAAAPGSPAKVCDNPKDPCVLVLAELNGQNNSNAHYKSWSRPHGLTLCQQVRNMAQATHLQMDATPVLDDYVNAVHDYVADGFDTFEEYVRRVGTSVTVLGGLGREAGPLHDPEINKAVAQLYEYTEQAAVQKLLHFELRSRKDCFAVPDALLADVRSFFSISCFSFVKHPTCFVHNRQEGLPVSAEYTEEDEKQLNEELEELRNKIALDKGKVSPCLLASSSERANLMKRELLLLQKEFEACEAQGAELLEATKSLGDKENVAAAAANAKGIVEAARKLQPLLQKAEALKSGKPLVGPPSNLTQPAQRTASAFSERSQRIENASVRNLQRTIAQLHNL